jgi:hypothetical protein
MHNLVNFGHRGSTPFPIRQFCDNIHKLWSDSFYHNQPHRLTRLTRQNASSGFHVRDKDLLDRDRCAPWRRIVAFRRSCELLGASLYSPLVPRTVEALSRR